MRYFFVGLILLISKAALAQETDCPFSLGQLCFQPAVGAMYAKKTEGEDYKDIRFAAVLHEEIKATNKHSFAVMVAPGEKFIDAVGFGGAYGFIKLKNDKYAVLNYGVLAKRYSDADDVRGGVYLMLSYSFGTP